jgi:tight adherence protein B
MTGGALIDIAAALAGLGAGALVCGLFMPVLYPAPSLHSRTLAALIERAGADARTTRSAKRAQEIALRLVAEERRMQKMTRLSQKLADAGVSWSARSYMVCAGIAGLGVLVIGLAMRLPLGACLSAAMMLAVLGPAKLLDRLARRRQQHFLDGFAGAVEMIVRSVRSGLSLPDCLGMVANDAAPAVRREFAPMVAQLRAGVPLAATADKLAARMPVPEVRFFAIVLAIQSQTGGNFTEALANLAGLLRERERLRSKVRTASAEVKASAITIGSLPFIVGGATALLAPDYIAVLWQEEAGRQLVGASLIWLMIGIAVLRKMARIEG